MTIFSGRHLGSFNGTGDDDPQSEEVHPVDEVPDDHPEEHHQGSSCSVPIDHNESKVSIVPESVQLHWQFPRAEKVMQLLCAVNTTEKQGPLAHDSLSNYLTVDCICRIAGLHLSCSTICFGVATGNPTFGVPFPDWALRRFVLFAERLQLLPGEHVRVPGVSAEAGGVHPAGSAAVHPEHRRQRRESQDGHTVPNALGDLQAAPLDLERSKLVPMASLLLLVVDGLQTPSNGESYRPRVNPMLPKRWSRTVKRPC